MMGKTFRNGSLRMVCSKMAPGHTPSRFQPMEAGVSCVYLVWQENTNIATVGGTMTGLAASSGGSADFTLTITALLPCNLPVAMECGSNSDPAFDTSQWEAWSVDHFLSSYYTNYTNGAFGSPGSFMDTFYNDFTDGEGSAYDQCNVTDTAINNCNWIGSCHFLATSRRPDLIPYEVPAYLTMYAMRSKYPIIPSNPIY